MFNTVTDLTWADPSVLRWPIAVCYLTLLALITVYGLHRWWMIGLYIWTHRQLPRPAARFDDALPRVTVQIPMFNERAVAQRVIDAVCKLDYPSDRLQVQVLDDSSDQQSALLAQQRVRHWQRQGVNAGYLRRMNRRGFKAGALADAMPQAEGQLIAVFDADFVPPADFLRRTVDHFTDQAVGMVQARWSHLNRPQSLLTRCEAMFIDGHFAIEQAGRQRSGRWFHFNGTAGIWRREAIEQAGGWSADTLCEDLDLSIRAQMAGWRFVYLNDVACPAELPPTVAAFKQQQHRWFKGTIQVMRKLLGPAMRSGAPWWVKLELVMQLTGPLLPVFLTLMALAYLPVTLLLIQSPMPWWWATLPLFGGLAAATSFYAASQYVIGRSVLAMLILTPVMVAIGMSIALTNTRGVIEALMNDRGEFLRTPKFNQGRTDRTDDDPLAHSRSRCDMTRCMPAIETACGIYMLICIALAVQSPATWACIPLLALFALGYLWFATSALSEARRRRGQPVASIEAISPPE